MRKVMFIIGVFLITVMTLGGGSLSYADLNDGLVAYYPFDDSADDKSGNGNHGVEYGELSYVPGKIGQAANFDGADDYIDINPADIAINSENNNYSIAGWVNAASGSQSFFISIKKIFPDGGYLQNGPSMYWGEDWLGSKKINIRFYSGQQVKAPTAAGLSSDQWYHFVGVCSSDKTLKLYINGRPAAFGSYSEHVGFTATDFQIGRDSSFDSRNRYFKGMLDDIRIYDHVLSESKIQDLYKFTRDEP